MLRVTLEIVPHGDERLAQVIGRLKIANDGTGTLERGNYTWALDDGKPHGEVRRGRVRGFPRAPRGGAWRLLRRVLGRAIR